MISIRPRTRSTDVCRALHEELSTLLILLKLAQSALVSRDKFFNTRGDTYMVVRMNTIYMAGGLFSIAERRFNRALRDELEMLGYTVFLPQESEQNNRDVIDLRAIARDDQRGVYESEVTVVNCDGAMVDDGTALEAGMAIGKCRITVGYRTDFRGFGDDADLKINCMFHLLGDYIYFSSLENDADDAEMLLASKIHQSILRQRAIRQSDGIDDMNE